jgi:hypothetical protein
MISKRLFKTRTEWSTFLQDFVSTGGKVYYGTLPDFPFIAVYDEMKDIRSISFVTMKDFR